MIFTQLWQVILSGFKNPINSLSSEHHPLNKYKKKTNWIVFNIKQTRTILQPCRHIWVMVGDSYTHIHTHIHIHKQSFRERLDDGDFQYGLNVLLIILFSQVENYITWRHLPCCNRLDFITAINSYFQCSHWLSKFNRSYSTEIEFIWNQWFSNLYEIYYG